MKNQQCSRSADTKFQHAPLSEKNTASSARLRHRIRSVVWQSTQKKVHFLLLSLISAMCHFSTLTLRVFGQKVHTKSLCDRQLKNKRVFANTRQTDIWGGVIFCWLRRAVGPRRQTGQQLCPLIDTNDKQVF